MKTEMFHNDSPGNLVAISGSDPLLGSWEHHAFVPNPLGSQMPQLSPQAFLQVADARASLAALDSTARQLPNPTLLRTPSLRREAQSTSALEGTYAPLVEVLTADDDEPTTPELLEILNYVRTANYGVDWVGSGRPITASLLNELHGLLLYGTALHDKAGGLRDSQVVIGRREDALPTDLLIHGARFVPSPPGLALESGVQELVDWLRTDHSGVIDPIVAAAMSHYQFETLHPYFDGNGRIGRLLIVLYLQQVGVLSEPTLAVSPWFEARRTQYYDHLLSVSTSNDWDGFVQFFAQGLNQAAQSTRTQMIALVAVQEELKDMIRASTLRADSAQALVDVAVANPSFTVRKVEAELGLSYGRANKLVGQLVDLDVLDVVDPGAYKRRFFAPRVLEVLTSGTR